MAAITFNTAQRAAERLEAVLTAVGEKFDVFVSYQMRQAAAETEPARTPPDDEPAGTATPFRPLDAGIRQRSNSGILYRSQRRRLLGCP